MTAPYISVVIDTFNHERYIEQAIVSVREQDFPRSDIEILVVDDGSTDRTPEIVRKFEPYVRLLRKPNGGQASAINFGTAHAKGALVAFLDGDDLWLSNKLSRVAKEFEKEPLPVLAYHRFSFWDVRDNYIWDPGFFNDVSGDVLADRRKLLTYKAAPTSSLVFRREILERLMPIPEECSFLWDAYAVSTAIFLGPVAAVAECLARNTVHGDNLWFAERGQANPEILRRRIKVREAAIESIRKWLELNASPSSRPSVHVLLEIWRVIQETDEFQLKPPGRIELFRFHMRKNRLEKDVRGRKLRAINCFNAFGSLATGYKHFSLLDTGWTKLDQGKERLSSLIAGRLRREGRKSIK
jgi:glycosyltransferase involved in cell wall biosynthesis